MDGTYHYEVSLAPPPSSQAGERLRAELQRAQAFLPHDPLTAHGIASHVEEQLRALDSAHAQVSSLLVQAQHLVERSREASQAFRAEAARRNRAYHGREHRLLRTPLDQMKRHSSDARSA